MHYIYNGCVCSIWLLQNTQRCFAPGPSRISPPNLNGREPSAAGACQGSKRGLGRLEMKKNGGLMWFAHGE